MAFASRLHSRVKTGAQRPKINGDENAIINKHVKQPISVVPSKSGPVRPALGEVTKAAVNKQSVKAPAKAMKQEVPVKRVRSSSLATGTVQQRLPLRPIIRPTASTVSNTEARVGPLRPQRPPFAIRQSETAPELHRANCDAVADGIDRKVDIMEIEYEEEDVQEFLPPTTDETDRSETASEFEEQEDETDVPVEHIWPDISPRAAEKYQREIEEIRGTFHDDIDPFDTTMVSEYAEEIFEYMSKLELEMMPNADYMLGQSEINWGMRQTLVDWLLQVHLRYHLLPETLWIAINLMDRFLSKKVVSVVKLQLVGVTAMFIAAKYEEILAPSVEEFVHMTEGGYTKDQVLKGERIILQTLNFKVSSYCSPYSWVRRISKADEYDLQTRTLCKYLVEVTLLDYRFVRIKPSLVAAVGMYTARRMLGGDWNDAFIYYSGYTEEHLIPGFDFIVSKLLEPEFDRQYVSRKYANKKFLKASVFAIDWARERCPNELRTAVEEMES